MKASKETTKDLDKLQDFFSLEEIHNLEKSCIPFNLQCRDVYGKWGIYWQFGDHFFYVDPIALTSSLFRHLSSSSSFREDAGLALHHKSKEKGGIFVAIRYDFLSVERDEFCVEWEFQKDQNTKQILRFKLDDYVKKVRKAIKAFYQLRARIKKTGTIKYLTVYDNIDERFWEALELCIEQLSVGYLFLPCYKLKTNNMQAEVFSFEPQWSYDKNADDVYYIGIGKRGYCTCLTEWSCYYERIRHQLESYIFNQETEITLSCEDCDTVIKIKKKGIWDGWHNETGKSHRGPYKPHVLITIEPNEFDKFPILQGYCEEKHAIKTLYEGLLRLALSHDEEREYDKSDKCPRMALYNMFKSPIIENFLARLDNEDYPDYDRDEPLIRQQNIRTVLKIDPDYDVCIWCLSEEEAPFAAEKDDSFFEDELLGKNGQKITIKGFYDWQSDVVPAVMAMACGDTIDFDWADFHKRGIALAKELREQLPDDVDLWYEAPFEDPSGIVPQPFLVSSYLE